MQAPSRDGQTQYLHQRGILPKTLRVSHSNVIRLSTDAIVPLDHRSILELLSSGCLVLTMVEICRSDMVVQRSGLTGVHLMMISTRERTG
jgi:hypothetical protein